eukprot:6184485-Pleurochrysis_carterae.AAC.1
MYDVHTVRVKLTIGLATRRLQVANNLTATGAFMLRLCLLVCLSRHCADSYALFAFEARRAERDDWFICMACTTLEEEQARRLKEEGLAVLADSGNEKKDKIKDKKVKDKDAKNKDKEEALPDICELNMMQSTQSKLIYHE